MQNFPQQLQTPISQKQKMFSGFFIAYLECASNLEHFEKKDEDPSLVISEIIDSELVGYFNVTTAERNIRCNMQKNCISQI